MGMTNYEAYKKRKRNTKVFSFHSFADPGCPIVVSGPFRDNIRQFLRECCEIEGFSVGGMPIWCVLLANQNNGVVVPLYIVEDTVNKHSSNPFCDHCRSTGWSHHFVSKRRYHFIIPMDDEWNKPLGIGDFDVHTHILHGLIHCNGFGHLLCINGIEGGSRYLCGREVMDLWDRICTALRARKITVEDTSTKRSMDLRVLHGVAYGQSWFGRWGYKFCNGSFGVTAENYESAIAVLSSLTLDEVVKDFANVRHIGRHIKQIVQVYRHVSGSQLITIRDLLRVMLALKCNSPPQKKSTPKATPPPPKPPAKVSKKRQLHSNGEPPTHAEFSIFANENSSRWPARRLEYVAEVIVDALKEKQGGMSRQELRDAARLHVGDTGLLDYVIKSVNNHSVGNYVVRRSVDPSTKVLQFTVQRIGVETDPEEEEVAPGQDLSPTFEPTKDITTPSAISNLPGMDVYGDLEYVYQHVLEGYPNSELLELAIQVLLDSKHFVKEWPFKDEDDEMLRFMCQILPLPQELGIRLTRPLGPGEPLVLPPYVTVGELKTAAENTFKDTYCIMERATVREVEGLNYVDDDDIVFGSIESGAHIWVRGTGMDLDSTLKYEGGAENWLVNCSCGAMDDDGERMIACDMCEVWQHTRCLGFEETEMVPPLFLCTTCSSSLLEPLTDSNMELLYA
ncbi:hypothetical protein ACHQM5_030853 [Ranunculus cassubicifolius]